MNLTLKIWRQRNREDAGRFVTYPMKEVSPDMSFLEMLDVLNVDLVKKGEEPVAFDHDCREGICGSCGLVINGRSHGPERKAATCELRMRRFKEGDVVTVEPWRARPFPIIKDLVVDRTSFDRIMEAGGYVSTKTGGVPDGNAVPALQHVQIRLPCFLSLQRSRSLHFSLRVSPSGRRARSAWSNRWTKRDSATVRIRMHVNRNARKKFPSRTSPD